MNIAIDIGNNRMKVVSKRGDASFGYSNQEIAQFNEWLVGVSTQHSSLVAISSVNPPILAEIRSIVNATKNAKLIDLSIILTKYSPIDFSGITGMGDDRKLGLIAALSYFRPPLITIDCGTAITINVLDANQKCLGGSIMPGVTTQLRCLQSYTQQLPSVKAEVCHEVSGTSTATAMSIGALRGSTGAIKEIIKRIVNDLLKADDVKTVITGGEAELLMSELRDWQYMPRHYPLLVNYGILRLLTSFNSQS